MDTVVPSQTPTRPFFWSFSTLESFETCAKKYYHSNVAKDFVETDNENRKWGFTVHDAFARAINHKSPLPVEIRKWEPWVKFIAEPFDPTTTIMKAEEKLAITEQMNPCEYFDKKVQVWFRCTADVLKISGPVARIVDWKTGKSKTFLDPETNQWKSPSEQLNLTAATVMAHYPMVQLVKTQFVFLKEDFYTEDFVGRWDLPKMWQRMLPRVDRMKLASRTGEYKPNPSGLCKAHCPVKTCPHHGIGSFG